MPKDAQGHAITAASDAAAKAFDHAMAGYLKYRADGGARLKTLLDADGEMPLAHVLKGSFAMLSYNAAMVAPARDGADLTRFAQRTSRHEWLDGERLAALEPDLAGRFRRALYFPDEAHLDPRKALAALAATSRISTGVSPCPRSRSTTALELAPSSAPSTS